MWFVVLAALAVFLLYWTFIRPLNYWKNRNVKHDAGIPIFGSFFKNVIQRESFLEFTEKTYKKFEGERYCGFYQFSTPILMVRDPELIKQIGVKDFDIFQDHQVFSREDIDPLWSKSLFSSKGEKWREMRPTLSPSFTGSKMKAMFSLIVECSEKFVTYFWEKNDQITTIEIKDTFTRYTNDVIATCAFGVTCDSLRERENDFFLKGVDATDFAGLKGLKFIINPAIMKLLNIKIFSDEVGNFFRKLIDDTIKVREEKGIVRPDMIHLMLEERRRRLGNDKKSEITNEDMTAQALIFFLAGFDTTSNLMVFLAYELAINKDIQDRLIAEVDEALEECNGKITYDGIMKMKYLEMIINETLRKWPPTPSTDRVALKDYKIPAQNPGEHDLIIEKGTNVWFPMGALQRDPQYYPNPDKFDPERFSDENKDNINPATNITFGIGPRACIGSRFALMETKAIIFQILTRFEIVPVSKTKIPVVLSKKHFSAFSEGGMWLGLKRRGLKTN